MNGYKGHESGEELTLPKIVTEIEKNYIVFQYYFLVEDRRPDLTENEALEKIGYKYKVQFSIYIFGKKVLSYIGHTALRGYINLNGKEL